MYLLASNNSEVGFLTIPILQMERQRLSKVSDLPEVALELRLKCGLFDSRA